MAICGLRAAMQTECDYVDWWAVTVDVFTVRLHGYLRLILLFMMLHNANTLFVCGLLMIPLFVVISQCVVCCGLKKLIWFLDGGQFVLCLTIIRIHLSCSFFV